MIGDVYFGCIVSVSLGNYGKKLIEIILFFILNFIGFNSVVMVVGNDRLEKFFLEDIVNKLDILLNNV